MGTLLVGLLGEWSCMGGWICFVFSTLICLWIAGMVVLVWSAHFCVDAVAVCGSMWTRCMSCHNSFPPIFGDCSPWRTFDKCCVAATIASALLISDIVRHLCLKKLYWQFICFVCILPKFYGISSVPLMFWCNTLLLHVHSMSCIALVYYAWALHTPGVLRALCCSCIGHTCVCMQKLWVQCLLVLTCLMCALLGVTGCPTAREKFFPLQTEWQWSDPWTCQLLFWLNCIDVCLVGRFHIQCHSVLLFAET